MTHLPVVVLAGGHGTRIKEKSNGKPKALIDVLGEPFLFWKLNELIEQGVDEIFILGHIGASEIVEFLKAFNSGMARISFIDDGEKPKGTLGAIRSAINSLPDSFILTYGDNLLQQRIDEFEARYLEYGIPNLLVVTDTITSLETANTAVKGRYVTRYSKTPLSGLVLNYLEYGYSIWSSASFAGLQSNEAPLDMASFIDECAKNRNLAAFVTNKTYFEIGTPLGLERTKEWLASQARN